MVRRSEVRPFRELATFRNGINFAASQVGRGVRVVGVGDISEIAELNYETLFSVEPAQPLAENDFIGHGDLLFVRSNGNPALVGRCMLVQNPPPETTHSGFTIRAVPNPEIVHPSYLLHYLRSSAARKSLRRLAGGSNISNLSQAILVDRK